MDHCQLLTEYNALKTELAQCQVGKDFAWSLWQSCQTSNPNVSDALTLAVQREKQNHEEKDCKVLEIIQAKDQYIEDLEIENSQKSQQISELMSKNRSQLETCTSANPISDTCQESSFVGVKDVERKKGKSPDIFDPLMQGCHSECVNDTDLRFAMLTSELEMASEEKSLITARRLGLEYTVQELERRLSEKVARFDSVICEVEEKQRQVDVYEKQVQQLTSEIEFKDTELENSRCELDDLWKKHNQLTNHSSQQAELIHQLQSLQNDTEIMIKQQGDAYSINTQSLQEMYSDVCTRYQSLKQTEVDLRQKIFLNDKKLVKQDSKVMMLQERLETLHGQLRRSDLADIIRDAELENADWSTLEARRDLDALRQLERTLDLLDQSMEMDGNAVGDIKPVSRERSTNTCHRSQSTRSTVSMPRRSRSLSVRHQAARINRSGEKRFSSMADMRRLLMLREQELQSLRVAHSRRLELLKAEQRSSHLLREQLKTYDRHPQRTQEASRRTDPSKLRQVDSDGVWNELAYFKQQHRQCVVEKSDLQQQVDELRLQAAADASRLHQLTVDWHAEREDCECKLKKYEAKVAEMSSMECEVSELRSMVQKKDDELSHVEMQLLSLTEDMTVLDRERIYLKSQVERLQQQLAKSLSQIHDLDHSVQRGRMAFERKEPLSMDRLQRAREIILPVTIFKCRLRGSRRSKGKGGVGRTVRKYQRVLNRSIKKMTSLFENFNNDGWEEMSESEEAEDGSDRAEDTDTTGSLGQTIASVAASSSPVTVLPSSSSSSKFIRNRSAGCRFRHDPSFPASSAKLRCQQVSRQLHNPQILGFARKTSTEERHKPDSAVSNSAVPVLAASNTATVCPDAGNPPTSSSTRSSSTDVSADLGSNAKLGQIIFGPLTSSLETSVLSKSAAKSFGPATSSLARFGPAKSHSARFDPATSCLETYSSTPFSQTASVPAKSGAASFSSGTPRTATSITETSGTVTSSAGTPNTETSGPAKSGPGPSSAAASGPLMSNPTISNPAISNPAISNPAISNSATSGPVASSGATPGAAKSGPVISNPTPSSPAMSSTRKSGSGKSGPKASTQYRTRLSCVVSLKQKMVQMKRQLSAFLNARTVGRRRYAELKTVNRQLSQKLHFIRRRLRIVASTCQRLTAEAERLRAENRKNRIENVERPEPPKSCSEGVDDKHCPDRDPLALEARLKITNSEVVRQASIIRSLKVERSSSEERLTALQDRFHHLERDVSQKRSLLESQRAKLKICNEVDKVHDDAVIDLNSKLKLSSEHTEKLKVQVNCLRRQLKTAMQQRRDYEDCRIQADVSLEQKNKELLSSRQRCLLLETTLSTLEVSSTQRLQHVTAQGKAAVKTERAKLKAAQNVLDTFRRCLHFLCSDLARRVNDAYRNLRTATVDRGGVSQMPSLGGGATCLKHAQDTACSILSITETELEDIMSSDDGHVVDKAREVGAHGDGNDGSQWLKVCQRRIMSGKKTVIAISGRTVQ